MFAGRALILAAWALLGCEEPRSPSAQSTTPSPTAPEPRLEQDPSAAPELKPPNDGQAAPLTSDQQTEGGAEGSAGALNAGAGTANAPSAADACADSPCARGECCVSAGLCGKPMLVKDFGVVCLAAGDRQGSLDESCPTHSCQDPRAKCTFAGCRTQAGQCGLWLDSYQYSTGGWGDTFEVDLGCVVLTTASR